MSDLNQLYNNLIKQAPTKEEKRFGKLSVAVLNAIIHLTCTKLKNNQDCGHSFDEVFDVISKFDYQDKRFSVDISEEDRMMICEAVMMHFMAGNMSIDLNDINSGIRPTPQGVDMGTMVFINSKPMKVSAVYEFANESNFIADNILRNN